MLAVRVDRFRVLLALALLITLTPKIIGTRAVDTPKNLAVLSAVESFFVSQGFQSAGIVGMLGMPSVLVSREGCYLHVASMTPEGVDELSFKRALPPEFHPKFYSDEKIYDGKQPTARPVLLAYLAKVARLIGVDVGYPPVLALGVNGQCGLEKLPWHDLPKIPFRVF